MEEVIGIYLSVLTEDHFRELKKQKISELMKTCCWSAYALYEDNLATTGGKRPELARMLFDAKEGSIHKVVVWEIDGLFANNKEYEKTMHQLKEWGVDIILIQDEF